MEIDLRDSKNRAAPLFSKSGLADFSSFLLDLISVKNDTFFGSLDATSVKAENGPELIKKSKNNLLLCRFPIFGLLKIVSIIRRWGRPDFTVVFSSQKSHEM